MSTQTLTCEWCQDGAPLRRAIVLVGRAPGRPVTLLIDAEPHEGGRVVERGDGQLRMLARYQRARPIKPVFRVHGARSCGPNADP